MLADIELVEPSDFTSFLFFRYTLLIRYHPMEPRTAPAIYPLDMAFSASGWVPFRRVQAERGRGRHHAARLAAAGAVPPRAPAAILLCAAAMLLMGAATRPAAAQILLLVAQILLTSPQILPPPAQILSTGVQSDWTIPELILSIFPLSHD